MRQRSIFLSFFLLLTLLINAQSRNVTAFTTLSTSGNVRVELIKSNTAKLEYKMLKGNDTDLITEVKNGKLIIKTKNKWGMSNAKAEVKLYYTALTGVQASAGSAIQSMEAINTTSMNIASSSGSRISLIMNTNSANVDASSGSNISLSGSVKGLTDFEASSGSNIEASSLSTLTANAEASSGSNISIWAQDKITADASSGGNIKYKGQPTVIDTDKSSGGNIKKM